MSVAGDLTSSDDIRDRDVLGSPLRCSTALGRRSVPDTEDEDAQNKGMGLKEMEKVRTYAAPCDFFYSCAIGRLNERLTN